MELELEPRLRAFAAFARQRSFSRAAAELYISQPAVSNHITLLEKQVGTPLIVRHSRGGTLTPAGEMLAFYVLQAESLLAQAARGLAEFNDPLDGTLSLATSGTPGTYLLPPVLALFHEAHPGVKMVMLFGNSEQVIEYIRSHKAEFGIVGGLSAASEIEVDPLLEDDVILIGPASLASRRFEPRELQPYTWILREEGSATRSTMEAAWENLGIVPRSILEMPSWEALKLTVASGAGIAACSRFAVDVELKAGTLAILDVPRWKIHRTISIVYLSDTVFTMPAQHFLRFLRLQWETVR